MNWKCFKSKRLVTKIVCVWCVFLFRCCWINADHQSGAPDWWSNRRVLCHVCTYVPFRARSSGVRVIACVCFVYMGLWLWERVCVYVCVRPFAVDSFLYQVYAEALGNVKSRPWSKAPNCFSVHRRFYALSAYRLSAKDGDRVAKKKTQPYIYVYILYIVPTW